MNAVLIGGNSGAVIDIHNTLTAYGSEYAIAACRSGVLLNHGSAVINVNDGAGGVCSNAIGSAVRGNDGIGVDIDGSLFACANNNIAGICGIVAVCDLHAVQIQDRFLSSSRTVHANSSPATVLGYDGAVLEKWNLPT